MNRIATSILLSAIVVGALSGAQAAPILFTATLDGTSENPPNASPGTGFAQVVFDDEADTMRVQVTFSDLLSSTTAAHIHCCVAPPGTVGPATPVPTFPGFPNGVTAGAYDMTFDMTLASSYSPGFLAAHGGSVAEAEAALLAGLQAGMAYLNIHSEQFPAGEIRGFFQAAQEVPEPATLGLLGIGLAGLAALRRRR